MSGGAAGTAAPRRRPGVWAGACLSQGVRRWSAVCWAAAVDRLEEPGQPALWGVRAWIWVPDVADRVGVGHLTVRAEEGTGHAGTAAGAVPGALPHPRSL